MAVSKAAGQRLAKAISEKSIDGRFTYSKFMAILRAEGVRESQAEEVMRYLADTENVWTLLTVGQACASEARHTNEVLRNLHTGFEDLQNHFE